MRKQALAGALALALTAAGAAGVVAQETPPTVDIDVTPKKMVVSGADALKGGPTRLAFDFAGRGEVGFVVMELRPGVTRDQVVKAAPRIKDPAAAEKRYGRFVASTFLGNARKYATTITLKPATEYVIIDITRRGAVRGGFTTGQEAGTAVAPAPSVTVGLEDYGFDVPSTVPRTGTMRVENRGRVLHHMLSFPLRKGVNDKKLLRDLKAGKEPPRTAFAGPPSAPVEVVSPGTVNDVETLRRRGKVLFVCFLQDSPKKPPHAALGMAKVVTVE
ncbi:MAG: hypothetical protein AVDCRST_MAG17-1459 [uncultured Solirubrobacterales bacterium]|uniref:Secreted protein n=1 Tax=uncultured Solirubrobacterales bacterium TaxID=768556 RepID=A0A6J4SLG6_9ACTN|nr:MAG: hypothetical protein AVDCRST_MAG17-1459 [uncultured Solirubrobacterales bacterium]